MVSKTDALLGGSLAGFVVDISLFPIDTIKTRMQSRQGLKSLGISDLHKLRGVGAAAVGSMPSSALYFIAYEQVKTTMHNYGLLQYVIASSIGECLACLVRVPTEVIKQRVQAKQASSTLKALQSVLTTLGVRGLYVGYGTTVFREIPFAAIQYPIWEVLKSSYNPEGSGVKSGVCGSVAGAIAGGVTTPIDVMKTRLMLAQGSDSSFKGVVTQLYSEGWRSFYSGFTARVGWLSVGGFVYLGTYEAVLNYLRTRESKQSYE